MRRTFHLHACTTRNYREEKEEEGDKGATWAQPALDSSEAFTGIKDMSEDDDNCNS